MRRQPVVVALVVGALALVGITAAPVPAAPATADVTEAVRTVAVPTSPAAPAGSAAQPAGDGLDVVADTTFVVDPAARVIRVTTEATLTNQMPDTRRGNTIEQHYFFGYSIPVLSEAENARATKGDGTRLDVSLKPSGDAAQQWVELAEITLSPRLHYPQTQTIELSYDLPYQPPRSAGLLRANDALVMFPAFTPGDPGQARLEVQLPSGYVVEVVGDTLDQQERDGRTVLSSGPIPEPDVFTPIVVATDDDKLLSQQVQVGGRDVEVRAWPDDQEWADFVTERLGAIMPALEELIDQPWPTERGLSVIETASTYAHGYAGWYSQIDHSISLGDELDALVIAHELAHVWFNGNLFDARWINEGFADEYAQTTMEQIGEDAPAAPTPDRGGAGAVALNDWTTPSLLERQDEATEAYGYAASWYVIDQIAAEIGVDRLREVVDAAADDHISYLGDPDAEDVQGVAGWRRLLDLLENVGGSQRASELFGQYVVNGDQQGDLAARAEARAAYASLAERGGEWTPPLAVRLAMTEWEFAEATEALLVANAVLDVRDDIDGTLAGLDVDDLALEDGYETARELDDVSTEAAATLDAARAYGDADARLDAGPGLIGTIGLIGSGIEDRLDDAAGELASGDPSASLDASAAVEDGLDDATRDGLLRLGVLLVLLVAVGVGLGGRAGRGRRSGRSERRRSEAAQAEIDHLEALYARRSAIGRPADRPTSDPLWRRMDPDHPG